MSPVQADYEHLLELRTDLRRFLRWSERQAHEAGITPAQHQLLLAIKGHSDPAGPTIGDVAGHLVLRHHSAVGLVDRAAAAGLVLREQHAANGSAVRLSLTETGAQKLETLSDAHLEELKHLAPAMRSLWQAIEATGSDGARPGALTLAPNRREIALP
jgi:DNA-binding MarR family transcriptional regulator